MDSIRHDASSNDTNINVCGEFVNNSSLSIDIDCSGVEWPAKQSLCQWPTSFQTYNPSFINFTVSSARKLLRGRTVFINGDSTSRRLMWSLCNFLATDNNNTTTNSSSHKRSGDGCCGTQRVDIHCNIPSVLAEDIMIEYNPALHWHDTIAWLHNGDGLNKAYRLRNQTNGLKGLSNYNNSIPPEQMPISKEATSIHIFHPVAASWHQCVPPNGQDRMNWTKLEPSCELNQAVSLESHDDTQEVACRLISDFCPRFENATINVNDESSSIYHNYTKPPLHIHGLTNVLSSRGVVQNDVFNSWMLRIAHATSSGSSNICKQSLRTGVSKRKFYSSNNGGGGVTSCGFHDQTTWMSINSSSPNVRADCMPSDGWAGIHIYNEYAQLMRVQLLLNSILKAEEESWKSQVRISY